MRRFIDHILRSFISNDFVNKAFPKIIILKSILWFAKRFVSIPWSDSNIVNWYDLILIRLSIKKESNIYFKLGFIFENCSISNMYYLSQCSKILSNKKIKLRNVNTMVEVIINNYIN